MIIAAVFVAGLAYREYKRRKNDLLMKLLIKFMTPSKKTEGGISEGSRTISKTFTVPYTHAGVQYVMTVPIGRRKKWSHCFATMKDGQVQPVTDRVKIVAGPYGNFFGAKLSAGKIIRGATKLQFVGEDFQELFTM